jgi:sarcosine oxidase, subunit beta
MVETQYLTRPEIEVRGYGRESYTALQRDHGLEFRHGGYLRLGHTADDVTRFERSVQLQQGFGIPDAAVLSAGDGWRLQAGSGVLEADVVVNAAGAWAGRVGDLLGAPVWLTPQLHGALIVEVAGGYPPTPFVMDYLPGSGVDGGYFRTERADQLIAGVHTEEAIKDAVSPDIPLVGLAPDIVHRVVELLATRLRQTERMSVGRSWTGLYPMTPDHAPVVGRHPEQDTVVCAVGAGGYGIQLAPAIGHLAAAAVLGDPAPFCAELRWQPGR